MTAEKYNEERPSEKTLSDVYRAVNSIDEKVEDILEELRDLTDYQKDRSYRGYGFDEYH